MQWYPEDWIKDTRHLSLAAKGAWIDILNLMWVNEQNRGQYSAPEIALARAIGATAGELKLVLEELKTVADVSFSGGSVQIMSRRIIREEKAREYERNRKRVQRSPEEIPSLSQKRPDAHTRDQRPETRSQRPDKSTDLRGELPPRAFEMIWEKYPRQKGRKEAERHFKTSVKTSQDFLDIQNALENYKREILRDHTEPQYVKHGSTWFNNWRDDVNYRGVQMPRAQAVPAKPRPQEPPRPDMTEEDLQEIHMQTVTTLKRCPIGPKCCVCAEIAKGKSVIAKAMKKTSDGVKSMPKEPTHV